MLSDKQLQHVCLAHQGAASCRYMKQDPQDWRKCLCVKLLPALKKAADKAVEKHVQDCKAHGVDPYTQWTPVGNGGSCKGYLPLSKVLQGYDVKTP